MGLTFSSATLQQAVEAALRYLGVKGTKRVTTETVQAVQADGTLQTSDGHTLRTSGPYVGMRAGQEVPVLWSRQEGNKRGGVVPAGILASQQRPGTAAPAIRPGGLAGQVEELYIAAVSSDPSGQTVLDVWFRNAVQNTPLAVWAWLNPDPPLGVQWSESGEYFVVWSRDYTFTVFRLLSRRGAYTSTRPLRSADIVRWVVIRLRDDATPLVNITASVGQRGSQYYLTATFDGWTGTPDHAQPAYRDVTVHQMDLTTTDEVSRTIAPRDVFTDPAAAPVGLAATATLADGVSSAAITITDVALDDDGHVLLGLQVSYSLDFLLDSPHREWSVEVGTDGSLTEVALPGAVGDSLTEDHVCVYDATAKAMRWRSYARPATVDLVRDVRTFDALPSVRVMAVDAAAGIFTCEAYPWFFLPGSGWSTGDRFAVIGSTGNDGEYFWWNPGESLDHHARIGNAAPSTGMHLPLPSDIGDGRIVNRRRTFPILETRTAFASADLTHPTGIANITVYYNGGRDAGGTAVNDLSEPAGHDLDTLPDNILTFSGGYPFALAGTVLDDIGNPVTPDLTKDVPLGIAATPETFPSTQDPGALAGITAALAAAGFSSDWASREMIDEPDPLGAEHWTGGAPHARGADDGGPTGSPTHPWYVRLTFDEAVNRTIAHNGVHVSDVRILHADAVAASMRLWVVLRIDPQRSDTPPSPAALILDGYGALVRPLHNFVATDGTRMLASASVLSASQQHVLWARNLRLYDGATPQIHEIVLSSFTDGEDAVLATTTGPDDLAAFAHAGDRGLQLIVPDRSYEFAPGRQHFVSAWNASGMPVAVDRITVAARAGDGLATIPQPLDVRIEALAPGNLVFDMVLTYVVVAEAGVEAVLHVSEPARIALSATTDVPFTPRNVRLSWRSPPGTTRVVIYRALGGGPLSALASLGNVSSYLDEGSVAGSGIVSLPSRRSVA